MDRTVTGAAASAARDKYYVYRPILDLIGYTEGTDAPKGRGYNETLGYGIMLDGRVTKGKGPTVDLVSMTLDQVDELQTRMLKDPDNKRLNSSAIGRYQIVRTTMRSIKKTLELPAETLFDKELQDRCGCYLLGLRGIDKYLAGRLSEDTLINNLAQEWASLPTTKGTGYYGGQRAAVKPERVRLALAAVRTRHAEGQAVREVDRPIVPEAVEKEVKSKTGLWGWLTTIFGSGGAGLAGLLGANWQTVVAIGGLAIVMLVIVILLRQQIIGAVQDIRKAVEA